MRSLEHWSFQYAVDRFAELGYRLLHPHAPWICIPAIGALAKRLEPEHQVWEWGSGRSTAWMAPRCKRLISIENDPAWHAKVTLQLQSADRLHAECRLIEDPDAYVNAISTEPCESLDLVLVDGPTPLRAGCLLQALPKVRPGGWVVLDDAQRHLPSHSRAPEALGPGPRELDHATKEFMKCTGSWDRLWYSDGVKDTAFFQKPCADVQPGRPPASPS